VGAGSGGSGSFGAALQLGVGKFAGFGYLGTKDSGLVGGELAASRAFDSGGVYRVSSVSIIFAEDSGCAKGKKEMI